MKRTKLYLSLAAITVVLLASGCMAQKANSDIEEVLQLNNDILEDPLLKELDSLEASLLVQDELPTTKETSPTSTAPAVPELEQAPAVPKPATSEPAAAKPAAKSAAVAPAVVPVPTLVAPTETVSANTNKRVLFGVVRKVSGPEITLQVIQAKTLTPEELKKIKSGEKIPMTLLTEEVLTLRYTDKTAFERLENGVPVLASPSDIARGQRVRIAQTPSGEIKLLRIIRD